MPEIESETGEFRHQYDEIIQEPSRLRSLLGRCLSEQRKVELQIGRQVRIYFSRLVPSPELKGGTDPDSAQPDAGESMSARPESVTANDTSASPSNPNDSLYLLPMDPAIGNVQVRKHPDIPVTFRFFERMQTMEGEIHFQGAVSGDQGPLLRFSRPKELGTYRQRRHYRVQVIAEYPATLTLQLPGKKAITPRLQDISLGGLSCICPGPADSLPIGTKLTLTLEIPDDGRLTLNGHVRNHEPVPRSAKKEAPPDAILVGVQLTHEDRAQEDRYSSVVGRIQQIYLASLRQEGETFTAKKEPDSRKPSELTKLMALKKKKGRGFL
ncbi:MAG: PilZ domain-containing protein [Magnetococcales bacterium]|nr:PilZ domain-containing protein [Magnetococcales bacterium]